jgi:hypothetical protein
MGPDERADERVRRAEQDGAKAVRRAEITLYVAEENERLAQEWVKRARHIGERQVAQLEQLREAVKRAEHEAVGRSMHAEDEADALLDEAKRIAQSANEDELTARAALESADSSGEHEALRHLRREVEEAEERARVARRGVEEAKRQAREHVERALRDLEVARESARRVDTE